MSAIRDLSFADRSLAVIRAHLRTGMRRLAAWWLAELRDLLPEAIVTRLCDRGAPTILLHVASDGVRLHIGPVRGRAAHHGHIAWSDYSPAALDRRLLAIGLKRDDGTLGLVLPPTAFFHRTFDVPTRARERIHAVASQELEHRTPFRTDDVHLGMNIDPHQRNSQTLTIHQTIVRRDLVEAAVRRLDLPLAQFSFVASAANESGSPASSVPLRPKSDHAASATVRLVRALAAAAFVIAVGDGVLFWRQQESAIAATEAQAAIERERALAVRGLEDEIARVRSSLRALEERRRLPSTADLWRETSRVLPDNSWVTDWRVRGGMVSTAGFSATATELVGTFERSPLFAEASLDAPITLDALNGRERFSLVVRTRADSRFAQR